VSISSNFLLWQCNKLSIYNVMYFSVINVQQRNTRHQSPRLVLRKEAKFSLRSCIIYRCRHFNVMGEGVRTSETPWPAIPSELLIVGVCVSGSQSATVAAATTTTTVSAEAAAAGWRCVAEAGVLLLQQHVSASCWWREFHARTHRRQPVHSRHLRLRRHRPRHVHQTAQLERSTQRT